MKDPFIAFMIGMIFGGIVYGWYKPMVEEQRAYLVDSEPNATSTIYYRY